MNRRHTHLSIFATLTFVLTAWAGTASAASVTYLGDDTVTHENWRTTTVDKSGEEGDPDGDNAYGTDGYYVFYNDIGDGFVDGNVMSSNPSYVSSIADNGSQFAADPYQDFDDPTLGIGAGPIQDVNASLLHRGGGLVDGILTFVLSSDADFILTVILSGNDPSNKPATLAVTQTVGGSATDSAASIPGSLTEVEYLFFAVTGTTGDTFDVVITGIGNTPNAGIAGVAFDSASTPAVPTPAALPAGLSMLAFAAMGRRRR